MGKAGRRRRLLTVWLGTALLAVPSVGAANRLACLPGDGRQVFAVRFVQVPPRGANLLNAGLEIWATGHGLSYGSVGVPPYDGHTRDSLTVILQTARTVANAITIETSNQSRWARITIGNNCFAKPEDWRPVRRALNTHISQA